MSAPRSVLFAAVIAALSATLAAASAQGKESHATKAASPGHAAALGRPGDPTKVTRTIDVDMTDGMRFSPATIELKRGETVRFRARNAGQLKHELVLGTARELEQHAALMRRFPDMEHADPNQASADPGKTGELIWEFTKVGTFDFACLQPGHFEAGMQGRLVVKP